MPDTTTYNTIIKVWSHSLRNDCGYHAEEFLNEMWYYHDEYQKCRKNNKNGVDDIDTAGSSSTTDHSQQLILDITPDQFTYSTTIPA